MYSNRCRCFLGEGVQPSCSSARLKRCSASSILVVTTFWRDPLSIVEADSSLFLSTRSPGVAGSNPSSKGGRLDWYGPPGRFALSACAVSLSGRLSYDACVTSRSPLLDMAHFEGPTRARFVCYRTLGRALVWRIHTNDRSKSCRSSINSIFPPDWRGRWIQRQNAYDPVTLRRPIVCPLPSCGPDHVSGGHA